MNINRIQIIEELDLSRKKRSQYALWPLLLALIVDKAKTFLQCLYKLSDSIKGGLSCKKVDNKCLYRVERTENEETV